MKEFLLGLYLEYGERAFAYRFYVAPAVTFSQCMDNKYIAIIPRKKYNAELLPYKLTAKALEYIKTHD